MEPSTETATRTITPGEEASPFLEKWPQTEAGGPMPGAAPTETPPVDEAGIAFDADLHESRNGAPILRNNGLLKRKRGNPKWLIESLKRKGRWNLLNRAFGIEKPPGAKEEAEPAQPFPEKPAGANPPPPQPPPGPSLIDPSAPGAQPPPPADYGRAGNETAEAIILVGIIIGGNDALPSKEQKEALVHGWTRFHERYGVAEPPAWFAAAMPTLVYASFVMRTKKGATWWERQKNRVKVAVLRFRNRKRFPGRPQSDPEPSEEGAE